MTKFCLENCYKMFLNNKKYITLMQFCLLRPIHKQCNLQGATNMVRLEYHQQLVANMLFSYCLITAN